MPNSPPSTAYLSPATASRGLQVPSCRPRPAWRATLLAVACLPLAVSCGEPETSQEAQAEGTSAVRVADMTSRTFNDSCLTSGCHGELGDRRWLHGPAATGNCAACHEQEGPAAEHRYAPVAREASLCFSCHTERDPGEHGHEPYVEERCLDCHDPHGGASKNFLVTSTPAELCARCHEPAQAAHGHAPVEQGDCLACHLPHSSSHEHLLALEQSELCLGCHREYSGLLPENMGGEGLSLANAHQVLVDDGCLACHQVHGGSEPALLDRPSRELCESCHSDVIKDLPGAKTVHGAFRGADSCVQCHSPHASTFDHLLRELPGALCFECHDQEIAPGTQTEIGDIAGQIHAAEHVHLPVAEGDCTVCHLAHFSPQRSLLRLDYPDRVYGDIAEESYDLCFQCHDRALASEENYTHTGFRDGDRNLHFVHVNREKGRACDICHRPHGSGSPSLIRESFSFGPGEWPLPIDFIPTATGGSCAGACHEVKSYDNSIETTPAPIESKD